MAYITKCRISKSPFVFSYQSLLSVLSKKMLVIQFQRMEKNVCHSNFIVACAIFIKFFFDETYGKTLLFNSRKSQKVLFNFVLLIFHYSTLSP